MGGLFIGVTMGYDVTFIHKTHYPSGRYKCIAVNIKAAEYFYKNTYYDIQQILAYKDKVTINLI